MPPTLHVTPSAARRFLLRTLGLCEPHADVGAALAYHGYIQIDPINVCGRMHDLILRNRVSGYKEGDLMRYLHGDGAEITKGQIPNHKPAAERQAIEHHLPGSNVLVAFTLEAWPHLPATMRARTKRSGAWSGWLTGRERELAPRLIAEISERGPMGSADFADTRRAHRSVWGASSLVKSTLQKLFFHGQLLIAQRVNHHRRYDLPERVLPASILRRTEASKKETDRWLALLKLRQRRLTVLKRDELSAVADEVQLIVIENCPPLYCLRDDVPRFAEIENGESKSGSPRFLAPLDPLIYDRRVTAALWGFDYTWEVYTPPTKRVRGYYALPILAGIEIVGHVDPKADRVARKLRIMARSVHRGHSITGALDELAGFLGVRR